MVSRLVVRFVEIVLVALAAYTFVAVPIGRRTLLEHTLAIFSTEPAREAAEDVKTAAELAKTRAVGAIDALRDAGADAARAPAPSARPR